MLSLLGICLLEGLFFCEFLALPSFAGKAADEKTCKLAVDFEMFRGHWMKSLELYGSASM